MRNETFLDLLLMHPSIVHLSEPFTTFNILSISKFSCMAIQPGKKYLFLCLQKKQVLTVY